VHKTNGYNRRGRIGKRQAGPRERRGLSKDGKLVYLERQINFGEKYPGRNEFGGRKGGHPNRQTWSFLGGDAWRKGNRLRGVLNSKVR